MLWVVIVIRLFLVGTSARIIEFDSSRMESGRTRQNSLIRVQFLMAIFKWLGK